MNVDKFLNASVGRWLRRIPPHGREFAGAWLLALEDVGTVSDAGVGRLRRAMVEDVRGQLQELDGCGLVVGTPQWSSYVAAWCEFYPAWVAARLGDLRRDEPEVFISEAAARSLQSARDKAIDKGRKQAGRDAATGAALLALLRSDGPGVIRWEPEKIGRQLAPKARDDRLPNVAAMADALVRLGAAEWQNTPSGRRWALVLGPCSA